MAGSLNKVILIGNLGADPEIRRLNSGDQVANLRIATSESWRDRNTNERKERTEWHNIVIFNENLVKVVEQYLKKVVRSTLKVSCRRVNGKIKMVMIVIQQRLFCKNTAVSYKCLMGALQRGRTNARSKSVKRCL